MVQSFWQSFQLSQTDPVDSKLTQLSDQQKSVRQSQGRLISKLVVTMHD